MREWTPREDRVLLLGWEDGLSLKMLTQRLHRTTRHIRLRLQQLLGVDRLPLRGATIPTAASSWAD